MIFSFILIHFVIFRVEVIAIAPGKFPLGAPELGAALAQQSSYSPLQLTMQRRLFETLKPQEDCVHSFSIQFQKESR